MLGDGHGDLGIAHRNGQGVATRAGVLPAPVARSAGSVMNTESFSQGGEVIGGVPPTRWLGASGVRECSSVAEGYAACQGEAADDWRASAQRDS